MTPIGPSTCQNFHVRAVGLGWETVRSPQSGALGCVSFCLWTEHRGTEKNWASSTWWWEGDMSGLHSAGRTDNLPLHNSRAGVWMLWGSARGRAGVRPEQTPGAVGDPSSLAFHPQCPRCPAFSSGFSCLYQTSHQRSVFHPLNFCLLFLFFKEKTFFPGGSTACDFRMGPEKQIPLWVGAWQPLHSNLQQVFEAWVVGKWYVTFYCHILGWILYRHEFLVWI
jgi:hypothetical protein